MPVNFRLRPDEVRYIVEHSGARVLYVDPELDESLKDVTAEHRFVLGQDDDLYATEGSEPTVTLATADSGTGAPPAVGKIRVLATSSGRLRSLSLPRAMTGTSVSPSRRTETSMPV